MTIEDQVRASYYVPDPTSYSAPNTHSQNMVEPKRGGHISSAQHPSALDYMHKTKAYVPGPGSYDTPDTRDFAMPEGGRLNRMPPKDFTKPFDEYPRPDPGTYGIPHDPGRPRQVNGQFSKETRVSKYIMDEVNRSKLLPGPGAHDVLEAHDAIKPFLPEGGRSMMQGKPLGYFEVAPKLTQQNPDPGSYNLPGSINGHRAVGQLVYRYESATCNETRELVARMAGKADEAPGPGTYDLPDPPIAPTPSIKGRAISAMPHPFAYGCRPDYAGRFTTSVSVLHQSSAQQIFGTGANSRGIGGNGPRGQSKSSRPSSGDLLREKEVPLGLLAAEQPEAEVEWKAGGFASLRKSRSAPAPKPEHPSVAEAAKCYPKLQSKHRDKNVFLPWAARRSESLATHTASAENNSLKHGKWQLSALVTGIQKATALALEPLDEDRLKREAMAMLQDKARERMKLEGVSRQQQQIVLEEMRSVLEEHVKAAGSDSRGSEQMPGGGAGESGDAGEDGGFSGDPSVEFARAPLVEA